MLQIKKLIVVVILLYTGASFAQPDPLSIDPAGTVAIAKGLVLPKLTTQEILNTASPTVALIVYNITLQKPMFFDGSKWISFDNLNMLHKIGEHFMGGIVYDLDESAQHGWVVSDVDMNSMGLLWYEASDTAKWPTSFSHWSLPDIGELSKIYAQKNLLNITLGSYWSNTHFGDQGNGQLLFKDFGTGDINHAGNDDGKLVRTVKSF